MKTRRTLVPVIAPARSIADVASEPQATPLAGLERDVANLKVRLQASETALNLVQQRQDELAAAKLKSRPLPRPLRVLRKRLRPLGLWPSELSTADQTAATVWSQARQNAPTALKAFFDPMTPFEAWVAVNDLTPAAREDLEAALAARPNLPLISVLTPVHDTPEAFLREMVTSVLDQVYANWELCLVDDASSRPGLAGLLAELVALDPRIRLRRLEDNGGISVATNAAAAMARGEVLLFLDHDDTLAPDCLAEFALYYADHPDADLVYSDDDKIDCEGRRFAPQFKPDWSPTLLLSFMYMSHALSVRRSVYEALGGFRPRFDGAQDYDFALRAGEVARHVGHIERVLYHWRAAPGSTAVSGDAKPASFEAGRLAVEEALERRSISARAEHSIWAAAAKVGMFSLVFGDEGPGVTIVIPTYNKVELLQGCVTSLARTTYRNYEILVVDNGSDDPATLAYLAELEISPHHRVIRVPQHADGFNFSALNNTAVAEADTEFVLLLNNDTKVINPRWLSQMVGYAQMPGVGCVGAVLRFADGTVQHAGVIHGLNDGLAGHAFRHLAPEDWGYMGFLKTAREYSAVTAACLLTPRKLFASLGGLNGEAFPVAYNDVDYGFRVVESGRCCVVCPEAELFHFEGKTRSRYDDPREVANLRRLYRDWREPWFNSNLSLDDERFQPQARRAGLKTNRAVRTILVSHNLNPEGAPGVLMDLALGLKAAGVIDPLILSPREGPLRAAYEAAGIEVRLFTPPSHEDGAFEEGLDRLTALFAASDCEVVVVNTLHMFACVNAAHIAGLTSIWCQHESEPWETYFNFLAPRVRSYAYAAFAQAYRVTYVADATRRAWSGVQTRYTAQTIRHGIPPTRLHDELERWPPEAARAAVGASSDEVVLLVGGTICRRKGQLDLIQALAELRATNRRCRVFLAGAFAERDYLEEIEMAIASIPVSARVRVEILGPVDDMPLYYAAADIVVCTSRIESAPRVLVEAMAFSKPIVTTPVFGIPEMVDQGVNALFYEVGDTGGLAERLSDLIENDDRRRAMGKAGREVLESRPGYADMLQSYSEIIREAALARKNTRPAAGAKRRDQERAQ